MLFSNIKKGLILALVSTLISCGGDSEEDLEIDCSASDLAIELVSSSDATCDSPGQVILSATGGSGNFSFRIDNLPGQTSGNFNLNAGSYVASVTDETGCSASVAVTVNTDPSVVSISTVNTTDSECLTATGSLDVAATGGTNLFEYRLDNGAFQSSAGFTGVSTGEHVVTVRDSEGCEVSRDVQVLSSTSLSTDIMPILEANCAVSGCHNGSTSLPDFSNTTVVLASSQRINQRVSNGSMPPASRPDLNQDQIDLIVCWVNDGGRDN